MQYLTLETILEIHDGIMARDGGDSRVLSEGNLHQIVFRANLLEETHKRAATVLYSLCAYPAFREGNRRTALCLAEMILASDGGQVDIPCETFRDLVKGIDEFAVEIEDVEQFLALHPGKKT
jgi:prophage maintenance system killer protein